MNLTYLECEQLIKEIVDNKLFRNQKDFDKVMTRFMDFHDFKQVFLVNLVNDQIPEYLKPYYKKNHIRDNVNKLLKGSKAVVKDEYRIIRRNYFDNAFGDLSKAVRSFRKYLFLKEFESDWGREHPRERKKDFTFEEQVKDFYDHEAKRLFGQFTQINQPGGIDFIDFDELERIRIDRNPTEAYLRLLKKKKYKLDKYLSKQIKLRDKVKTKIDAYKLLKKLKA